MGRLVISHHKSYHPYRRDNIQRVRDDEEKARRQEENDDARIMLADSEARIALLRKRKPGGGARDAEPELAPGPSNAQIEPEPIGTTATGHINLFADLEEQAMRAAIAASKKSSSKAAPESDRGFPLAPPEKDLKPWYSSAASGADIEPSDRRGRDKETREERRTRDLMRKAQSDPLTSINATLTRSQASSSSSSTTTTSSASSWRNRMPPPPPARITSSTSSSSSGSAVQERLTREAAERARAAELIRRRRRELEGSTTATPSTVHGAGGMDEPYSDRYNRVETEEAGRRRRDRRW